MSTTGEYIFDAAYILESMDESVLITTADLDAPGPYIIYVNKSFELMTGWGREEILGKSPRFLQGPKTDLGIFHDMKEKLLNGETWRGRTMNYRKDRSEFYMQWSIVPVRNNKGEISEFLAVQKDVTSIVLTEMRLQKVLEDERKRLLEIEVTNKKLSRLIARQNKTLNLFKKYVPGPIVNKALRQNTENIRKGEKLEAALLFCDIRRFTTIAERITATDVVHFLNVYYSTMDEVIKRHNGVINQFVGDEIFVSFGAPVPILVPELSAVQCAIDMIHALDEISEKLKKTIGEDIVVGIGIHYGSIVAGNLGSEDRLSYSITGDAVNTAKRIESLTRGLPNTILISQHIYNQVKDQVPTKPLGEVPIKGKNEKISVYKVLGPLINI